MPNAVTWAGSAALGGCREHEQHTAATGTQLPRPEPAVPVCDGGTLCHAWTCCEPQLRQLCPAPSPATPAPRAPALQGCCRRPWARSGRLDGTRPPAHLEVAAVLRGVLERPERPHQLRQLLRDLAGRGRRPVGGGRPAAELLQRQELGEELGVAEALQDGVHEAGVAVVAQPRHAGHGLGGGGGARRGLGAARRARREAAAQAACRLRRGQARGERAAGLGLAAVVRERGEGLQHAAHEPAERPPGRSRGRGGGRGRARAAARRPPAEKPLAEGALLLGAAGQPGAAHPRHGGAAQRASPLGPAQPARRSALGPELSPAAAASRRAGSGRGSAASRRRHAAGGAGRAAT